MSLDKSEDAYMMPCSRNSLQPSPVPFSSNDSVTDDKVQQYGYIEPSSIHISHDNTMQAPVFQAPSLPLPQIKSALHHPKTLAVRPNASSTWKSDSLFNRPQSDKVTANNDRVNVPMNKENIRLTSICQPPFDRSPNSNITPPSLPIKPKRNAVLLSQPLTNTIKHAPNTPTEAIHLQTLNATSIEYRKPPLAHDNHNIHIPNQNIPSHQVVISNSHSSKQHTPVPVDTSTPYNSTEYPVKPNRPFAAVSPRHIVSPPRISTKSISPTNSISSIQNIPTQYQNIPIQHQNIHPLPQNIHTEPQNIPVQPHLNSHITSEQLEPSNPSVSHQTSDIAMPTSLNTSARLFTPIGYSKPTTSSSVYSKPSLSLHASDDVDSPTVDTLKRSIGKPPITQDTPNFYSRTGGIVRPLKFSPIRFSPKTTPTANTADQSFDFIDSSIEVLPNMPSTDDLRTSKTPNTISISSPPPALPNSLPPDF